ncbi:MAG: hypothetical protein QXN01_00580 [Candidatus Anstonellales archaeon]
MIRTNNTLLFFVLALGGFAFSQQAICEQPQNLFSPAISYATAGFAALAGLIAITYAAGEFLSYPRLVAWSKDEVMQLISTAIIIALILQILTLFCSIEVGSAVTLTNLPQIPIESQANVDFQESDNVYTAAKKFLVYMQTISYSTFYNLREIIGLNERKLTLTLWNCKTLCILGGSGVSLNPESGVQAHNAVLTLFMNSSLISLATILAQIGVYNILLVGTDYTNSFLIFCLVWGIILRSIPFMRMFGGSLIGLGVALYIFFPFLLMLEGLFFPAIYSSTIQEGTDVIFLIKNATLIFFGSVFITSINLIVVVAAISQVSGLLGQEVDAGRLSRLI